MTSKTLIVTLCACFIGGFIFERITEGQQSGQPQGIGNIELTITSGTPTQVTTKHILVSNLSIQNTHSATNGITYVCGGQHSAPSSKCSGTNQLSFELLAATSTAPGGQLGYPVPTKQGIDLSTIWIDGDTTGTPVTVSYNVSQ